MDYFKQLLFFTILCIILTVVMIFVVSILPVHSAECQAIWHDHYKRGLPNPYRVRHIHKICGTVEGHYKDDKLSEQIYYIPEYYKPEGEKNDR